MPKLFKDLDEDQREIEREHLDSLSESLTGLGAWDTPGRIFSTDLKGKFGICADCTSFFYCRQSYMKERAYCNRFEILLSGKDRMVECNKYDKRGKLNLNQMQDIAWIIETPKRTGFIS